MKPIIPETKLDDAVLLKESGLSVEKIGQLLGVGASTISRTLTAYNAAKGGDIEQLRQIAKTSSNAPVVWACKKFGINYDVDILGKAAVPVAKKEEGRKEDKTDNTAQAFMALLEAVSVQTEAIKELTKAVNTMDNRLNQMHLVLSGFRGDVGEKIKTVVEAINVNGNILTKEHERQTEHLNMIRSQTKKRPWQEGTDK